MNTHMLQNVIHTAEVAEKKVWEKIHQHPLFTVGLLLVATLLIVTLLTGLPQRSIATIDTEAKPLLVYDAREAMENAIVLPGEVLKPARAPVYDATSAMQSSVVNSWEARPVSRAIVYDATTAMQNSVVYSWQVKTPLVYDATAAMLEVVVFPSSDR